MQNHQNAEQFSEIIMETQSFRRFFELNSLFFFCPISVCTHLRCNSQKIDDGDDDHYDVYVVICLPNETYELVSHARLNLNHQNIACFSVSEDIHIQTVCVCVCFYIIFSSSSVFSLFQQNHLHLFTVLNYRRIMGFGFIFLLLCFDFRFSCSLK